MEVSAAGIVVPDEIDSYKLDHRKGVITWQSMSNQHGRRLVPEPEKPVHNDPVTDMVAVVPLGKLGAILQRQGETLTADPGERALDGPPSPCTRRGKGVEKNGERTTEKRSLERTHR